MFTATIKRSRFAWMPSSGLTIMILCGRIMPMRSSFLKAHHGMKQSWKAPWLHWHHCQKGSRFQLPPTKRWSINKVSTGTMRLATSSMSMDPLRTRTLPGQLCRSSTMDPVDSSKAATMARLKPAHLAIHESFFLKYVQFQLSYTVVWETPSCGTRELHKFPVWWDLRCYKPSSHERVLMLGNVLPYVFFNGS